MKKGIIYLAYCKCEKKYYIGQTTKDIETRKREHFWHAKSGSKTYFHRAILKHEFEFSIIEEFLSESIFEILNERERFWIDYYNSNNSEFGYNLNKGGRNSNISKNKMTKHKQETIDKIRKSLIGEKNPMYGKSVYDRWIELYGNEEADLRMQSYVEKHKKSHSLEKNGMFGKKQKDETKKIISEKAKLRTGKKASRYVSVDENKLLEMIESGLKIKDISKELNVSEYIIRNRIKEIKNYGKD
jgi:group I intron endonuclease